MKRLQVGPRPSGRCLPASPLSVHREARHLASQGHIGPWYQELLGHLPLLEEAPELTSASPPV